MFIKNKYKVFANKILQLLTLLLLIIGNFVEFLLFFIVSDSFTLTSGPIETSYFKEFLIFLFFSIFITIVSILLIKSEKENKITEFIFCIILLIINIIKLVFFIPSIHFNVYSTYILIRQFVPLFTNSIVILYIYYKLRFEYRNIY